MHSKKCPRGPVLECQGSKCIGIYIGVCVRGDQGEAYMDLWALVAYAPPCTCSDPGDAGMGMRYDILGLGRVQGNP